MISENIPVIKFIESKGRRIRGYVCIYDEELPNIYFSIEFEVQQYSIIFGSNFVSIFMELIAVLLDNLVVVVDVNEIDTVHFAQDVHVAVVNGHADEVSSAVLLRGGGN